MPRRPGFNPFKPSKNQRPCDYCGESFIYNQERRKNYCSRECYDADTGRGSIKLNCALCNQEMIRWRSKYDPEKPAFCSVACKQKGQSAEFALFGKAKSKKDRLALGSKTQKPCLKCSKMIHAAAHRRLCEYCAERNKTISLETYSTPYASSQF